MQLHPSEISPGEPFDIFFFIRNPLDNATYYVRAVIYDLKTGSVLATQNLTQTATNARLFVSTLQAPGDQGSIGRNIVAIASVYTDSGYSTKSDAYEEQEQYFLIRSPISLYSGGSGVDYGALRDIVGEEVSKALKKLPPPKDLKVPDMPDMSFVDALFGTLGALQREVNRIPKDQTDFSPLTAQLDTLMTAIQRIPTDPKSAANAIRDAVANINSVTEDLRTLPVETSQAFERLTHALQTILSKTLQDMEQRLEKNLTDAIESQEVTITPSARSSSTRQPTPSPLPAVDHLMK